MCSSCHKNIFFEHLFMDSVLSNSIASCDVRVYKKSGKIMGNNFKQQQYFIVLCPSQCVEIFFECQFTFSFIFLIRYLWSIFICKSAKTEQKSKKHFVITQIMQKMSILLQKIFQPIVALLLFYMGVITLFKILNWLQI